LATFPEPIKERSLLSRETQQRNTTTTYEIFLLIPEPYATEVYPIPICDIMRQLSKSLKLFSCP
jgi:hypothetical protein